jgi:hypothetical protein
LGVGASFLSGLGIWDLGFGIFQGREPPIEIGDRLFQHRAMCRCARKLEIGKRAGSRERQRGAFCTSRALVWTQRSWLCALTRRRFLLGLD